MAPPALHDDAARVRSVLARELETITEYERLASEADSDEVRAFFTHLADEEKEHVAEATEVLRRLDAKQDAWFERELPENHFEGGTGPTPSTTGSSGPSATSGSSGPGAASGSTSAPTVSAPTPAHAHDRIPTRGPGAMRSDRGPHPRPTPGAPSLYEGERSPQPARSAHHQLHDTDPPPSVWGDAFTVGSLRKPRR